jgi:hypothetical protein
MALELRGVSWFVDKEFDFAITDLVNAAVGENMPRMRHSGNDRVYEAARNMAEAYQTGQAVYKDDHWLVDENFQEAITALVFAVRENAPCGPYSDQVYEAARNVAEAYQAGLAKAFYFYRLTDIAEYETELDRRRQIGLAIDPATAETTIWWADGNDPYRILDVEYHGSDEMRREYFARNPGAGDDEWVHFHHLPIATRKALWERDKRLTDLDEYNAEIERRQHIGLTIDPATAETAAWSVDMFDPYEILDQHIAAGGRRTTSLRAIPAERGFNSATCPKRRGKLFSGSACASRVLYATTT